MTYLIDPIKKLEIEDDILQYADYAICDPRGLSNPTPTQPNYMPT